MPDRQGLASDQAGPAVTTVWEFDVGVSSHDLLQAGVPVAAWRRVEVAAPSYLEAQLVACQLAAAVDGAMPTACVFLG